MYVISPVGFDEFLDRLMRNDPEFASSKVPTGVTAFWCESLGRPGWMFAGTDLDPGSPLPREISQINDLQIMSNLLQMHGEARLAAMMLEWSNYPAQSQILAAPDLGAALQFVVTASNRKNPAMAARIIRSQGMAVFRFDMDPRFGPFCGIHEQLLLIWIFLIIRSFLGVSAQGIGQLPRIVISRLHSNDAIDALLPCEVVYDSEAASVGVPEELMDFPGLTFDPELWASILASLEKAGGGKRRPSSRRPDEIEHLVRNVLAKEARVPPFAEIAAELGLSERTLARNFAACGQTYRALIDKLRMAMAQEMLLQDGLKVKDLGHQLGYSDPSAFVRSFRRYSGVSPARWRKMKKREGSPHGGSTR
ncbi:Transcriptional regulator, AraC family protein [Erythrobacter dokdonensis DSW-74]|uniref:Transcriptional regulator, AraC family protein n=2 Tax=Erythrobacter TaxID=1041 RepID=A0A1A7BHA3_9SPHN|nr:Transcriptional regulator, AraC family protein [Erythrobacter dokdonensis DSW-74]